MPNQQLRTIKTTANKALKLQGLLDEYFTWPEYTDSRIPNFIANEAAPGAANAHQRESRVEQDCVCPRFRCRFRHELYAALLGKIPAPRTTTGANNT